MNYSHRILALLLSVGLCISLVPGTVFAEEGGVSAAAEAELADQLPAEETEADAAEEIQGEESAPDETAPAKAQVDEAPGDDNSVSFDEIDVDSEDESEEETVKNDAALTTAASGTCGDNLTWTLDDTGKLTISGTGEMDDYTRTFNSDNRPWAAYTSNIKKVTIASGVTSIGNYAFDYITGLTNISIPASVTEIGMFAFRSCTGLTDMLIPGNVTSIGMNAFNSCTALKTISFSGNAPVFGDNVFYGDTLYVYYPAGNTTWTSDVMQQYNGTVTWVASTALTITTQPKNVSAKVGSTAKFTVAANGIGLTYQWQYSTDSGKNWKASPATGNDTDTVSVSVTVNKNGYRYRCVIKDGSGATLTSNAVKLTVKPAITAQPTGQSGTVGSTVKFTLTATGVDLTYQWQYSTDSGSTWTNSPASGSTTSTLSVGVAANKNGYQYRCKITDANKATVTSSAVKLTVKPAITVQPADVSGAAGTTVQFTLTATGAGLTYQWQYSTDSGKTWTNSPATGCTTNTVSISAAMSKNGYRYRCVVKDANGTKLTSEAAKLTVVSVATITTQPTSVSAAVGSTAEFTVAAGGPGLTYQWQYSSDSGKTWTNSPASGSTTDTVSISVAANKNGYLYRCVVTDENGKQATSNSAELTVKSAITVQPADKSGKVGSTVKFTLKATGADLTYQWQYSNDSGKTWTNSPATGNKTDTLSMSVTAGRNGYLYRCIVTDANKATLTSSAAILTVKTTITVQPTDQSGTIGSTVKYTLTATGPSLTYQWQYSSDSGKTWKASPATGNKTSTLSVSVAASKCSYQYRCVVTDGNGKSVTSKAAAMVATITQNEISYKFINSTTLCVTGYMGSSSSVTVPETVDDYTVVEIGTGAFEDNTTLETITLPDTITVIGERAFAGCTSLVSMN